ncbi:hypothetical protein A0H81_11518 [Grifola frondosa]|uniref:Cyanovirin-N domain-containing protein n=1 Tax=Grifola frondosa TaxID=5627 RepID=A0A1C7LVC3_GRIFR|nr:hypothetical protein A0H81_11518 [Grifola frondosa]
MQLSFFSTISLSIIVASGLVAAREQNGAVLALYISRILHSLVIVVDFAATCGGFSLADGRFLFATCENFAGTGSDSTSIDLNECVENFAGTLECALKYV